uniref:Uncharacterized protein n=1 Tax=Ascaris lumbricoides TaxID=6252 RepID=A0A0M3I632_ASCLU
MQTFLMSRQPLSEHRSRHAPISLNVFYRSVVRSHVGRRPRDVRQIRLTWAVGGKYKYTQRGVVCASEEQLR